MALGGVRPHREPSPIKPHYFQGYHLLPNGVEIAAYLLVNNKKDTSRIYKKKNREKSHSIMMERERWEGGEADGELREISRDSFILWKGQADGDLPL